MNKLTAKQLQMFNKKIVAPGNEKNKPVLSMDVLEKIAAIPYEQDEAFFYIYRDTIEKAAILGCSIQKMKPFKEGNSETAILAMLTLLDVNGYEIIDYEKDIATLFEALEDYEVLCEWLKGHTVNKS